MENVKFLSLEHMSDFTLLGFGLLPDLWDCVVLLMDGVMKRDIHRNPRIEMCLGEDMFGCVGSLWMGMAEGLIVSDRMIHKGQQYVDCIGVVSGCCLCFDIFALIGCFSENVLWVCSKQVIGEWH